MPAGKKKAKKAAEAAAAAETAPPPPGAGGAPRPPPAGDSSVWRPPLGEASDLIIGIDLDDQYVPKMEQLCSITAMSTFINAAGGLEELNAAFAKVAALISGGDGLAMESL